MARSALIKFGTMITHMNHKRVKQGPNPDRAVNILRTVRVEKVPLLIRWSAALPKGYDATAVARYGRARTNPAWSELMHTVICGYSETFSTGLNCSRT